MSRFDERGAIGGIEGLAFGILIFAMGTLLVVNAWAVVNGKMTAGNAAREATRTYVEGAGNALEAQSKAQAVIASHGNFPSNISLQRGASFERCAQVTATVQISIPRISLPLIGGTGGTFPVSATHVEIIDPYRSGVASTATCF